MGSLLPGSVINSVSLPKEVSSSILAALSSRFGYVAARPVKPDSSTSKSNSANKYSTESARKVLNERLGIRGVSNLEKSGTLNFISGPADFPKKYAAFLQSRQDVVKRVKGFYDPDTQKAYIIVDNITNDADLVRSTLHEIGTHHNLKSILGQEGYDRVVRQVKTLSAANPVLRNAFDKVLRNYKTLPAAKAAYVALEGTGLTPGTNEYRLAALKAAKSIDDGVFWEEVIAAASENPEAIKQAWYQRIIQAVKTWLIKNGFKQLKDGDIADMVAYSLRQAAREAGAANLRLDRATDPLTRTTDQTDTPAFRKWFGSSKVVDANGEPMVVMHANTYDDITEFSRAEQRFGKAGYGFYFSNAEGSNLFAEYGDRFQSATSYNGKPKAVKTIPVYLSLQNPLIVDHVDDLKLWLDAGQKFGVGRGIFGNLPAEALTKIERAGYDGIISRETTAPKVHKTQGLKILGKNDPKATSFPVYVAFRPEQIKSAIGNNGQFDPSNPNIMLRVGQPASWDAPEPTKLDNFIYTLQDKQIDTLRAQQSIQKGGRKIGDKQDVRLNEELYHGRTAKRTDDFINDELKPLLVDMKKSGITLDQLGEYLHNRHAEEANNYVAKINPGLPDGGSGIDTQDARDFLSKLGAPRRALMDRLAKQVDAITARTRQTLVSYGLESQDTIDTWAKAYKSYVPLHREDMDSGTGLGQGYSVKGPSTKGRTGSRKKVVDVLANIAMQREKAIVRGEKNRVANALIGLAESNPNDDYWEIDTPPTITAVNPATGQVQTRVDPLYKSRENVVMARQPTANGDVVERAVVFNENDERAMRMAKALKNLDMDKIGAVLGVSAKISRYIASVNTQYNPIFGFVNLTRDFQGSLVNLSSTPLAGKQADVSKHVLSALAGIYLDARAVRQGKHPTSSWAQEWTEFQRVGGQTGYRDMFATSTDRAEALERELNPTKWMDSTLGKVFTANGTLKVPLEQAQKAAKGVFDWLSDYNTAMENAVRLATYKVGKANGLTPERAASIAKNISVNFNRKGQIATQAGALYAFFNASVQGTSRMVETLQGPAGKKILMGGAIIGVMQALALAAAGFDEDEPPEFLRDRNLIIPTGLLTGKKDYISIPMPLGLHVLPAIARMMTEYAMSGFKDGPKRVIHAAGVVADAFNPVGNAGLSLQTITPTAIDPIAALAENKDFTGKPIARKDFNSLNPTPGFTRGKDTSTALGKGISEMLNMLTGGSKYTPGVFSPTPDQIDYLLGQAFGGIGREYNKVEQTASSLLTGEELPSYKIPLLGRLYGSSEGQSAQANKYYENLKRINMHKAEIKGRREAHEDVAGYIQENPEAKLTMLASNTYNQVTKLRKIKRKLIEDGADPAKVRQVEDNITATMRRLNDRIRVLREAA
ncbi:LPD38 domain-containing protein [Sphingomonas sp.]|uniref:LPD38 domain-containing protein n=1 Tax=Sphingomonas sp. TaxID=28214 RepID=UPI0035652AE4